MDEKIIFLHGSQHNICLKETSCSALLVSLWFLYSENCFSIVLITNLGIYTNYSLAVRLKDNDRQQSLWEPPCQAAGVVGSPTATHRPTRATVERGARHRSWPPDEKRWTPLPLEASCFCFPWPVNGSTLPNACLAQGLEWQGPVPSPHNHHQCFRSQRGWW